MLVDGESAAGLPLPPHALASAAKTTRVEQAAIERGVERFIGLQYLRPGLSL